MKSSSIVFASAFFLAAGGALAQGAAPAAAGPTDAQIAHIVVTANQIDINAGKLAESNGTNKDVKAFGKLMVTDHSGVNKQATALVKKLKIKPEDNPTSKNLMTDGEQNIKELKRLKGKDFDRSYIDNEVAYHQAVLNAIDKTLVPNAKNEELKALIVKVQPAFVAHLEHARKIQASLNK